MTAPDDVLLDVRGLRTTFPLRGREVPAVDDVSFVVRQGETLGLVGESGSGKSVTALSLVQLVEPPGRVAAGTAAFEGQNLLALDDEHMRRIRGRRIGFIFQEPMVALDPVHTIGAQIEETLSVHGLARGTAARRRALELLDAVRVPDPLRRHHEYAHQLSGGLGGPSREQHGGVRAVAELFNRLERTVSGPVLEAIETDRPELAVSIRNLMFVFDDLLHVDDNGMREIVQRADKKALTVALKGASEEIRSRFFGNMSKRAAEMLKEEMEVLGAVRLRDVEKAQQDIVSIARKLEEEGVIVTGAAAGEAYVV
jgi:predicted ABC-type transport system involved in lysophospholipase L1 biosynthesis ATPase subunit